MTKVVLAKKALDILKDEKYRKQLLNVFILLLCAIVLPAVLFMGFLDSALSSFTPGESGEEMLNVLGEELDKSELDRNRKDACTYIFLTYLPGCDQEPVSEVNDVISTVKENESGEEILRTLSDIYGFQFDQNDIDILEEILGGKEWNP